MPIESTLHADENFSIENLTSPSHLLSYGAANLPSLTLNDGSQVITNDPVGETSDELRPITNPILPSFSLSYGIQFVTDDSIEENLKRDELCPPIFN